MDRTCGLTALLCTLVLAAGCATITTRGFQTINVATEPQGADCKFSQEGNVIARVNPTPGPMLVGKGRSPLSVSCSKDGYEAVTSVTGAEFQPMTFGNILLGGVIGVVVDASSGAMMKYPETITLVLVPQEFPSSAGRDAFFDDLSKSFLTNYEEVVRRIRSSCAAEECERQLQAAQAGRTSRLAEIEQKRSRARVRGIASGSNDQQLYDKVTSGLQGETTK